MRIHGWFPVAWVACMGLGAGLPGAVLRAEQGRDSVELVVRGCLKGKDLTALDISGADIPGYVNAIFKLSAKGDLEKAVRQQNGRLVDVTGTVKKTALAEPGIKVGGNARIVIGQPMSTDPTANPARNPQKRQIPMQVSQIALAADACPSFVDRK